MIEIMALGLRIRSSKLEIIEEPPSSEMLDDSKFTTKILKIDKGRQSIDDFKTQLDILIYNDKLNFGFDIQEASYPPERASQDRLYLIKDGYRFIYDETKRKNWLNQNNTSLNLDTWCNSMEESFFKDKESEEAIMNHFAENCFKKN